MEIKWKENLRVQAEIFIQLVSELAVVQYLVNQVKDKDDAAFDVV